MGRGGASSGHGREDKPILLSIGYSACHWCHVMERESFEDAAIAALMNEHFVSIKVDREERPDLDEIYMQAVQAMTGEGGWPLTVFLTPEGSRSSAAPTSRPTTATECRASRSCCEGSPRSGATRRDEVAGRRAGGARGRARRGRSRPEARLPRRRRRRADELAADVRRRTAASGRAPKFPPASALEFLCAASRASRIARARRCVDCTLDRMARGGIYDQLGGGFPRYSVDAHWLVPHFEKMLYDNALFARAYLHGSQVLEREDFARVCVETLDWALREMRSPEGGFYSALTQTPKARKESSTSGRPTRFESCSVRTPSR